MPNCIITTVEQAVETRVMIHAIQGAEPMALAYSPTKFTPQTLKITVERESLTGTWHLKRIEASGPNLLKSGKHGQQIRTQLLHDLGWVDGVFRPFVSEDAPDWVQRLVDTTLNPQTEETSA